MVGERGRGAVAEDRGRTVVNWGVQFGLWRVSGVISRDESCTSSNSVDKWHRAEERGLRLQKTDSCACSHGVECACGTWYYRMGNERCVLVREYSIVVREILRVLMYKRRRRGGLNYCWQQQRESGDGKVSPLLTDWFGAGRSLMQLSLSPRVLLRIGCG
jgi:hypothetical protein